MEMKRICSTLCLVLVAAIAFCEEWGYFVVIRDTPVRYNLRPNEVVRILDEGRQIVSNGNARFGFLRVEDEEIPCMGFLPIDGFSWITTS